MREKGFDKKVGDGVTKSIIFLGVSLSQPNEVSKMDKHGFVATDRRSNYKGQTRS